MSRPRMTGKELELSGLLERNPVKYSCYNTTEGIIPTDTEILPPKGLGKYGKKLWNSLVPDLISMRVLSTTDFSLLERLVFTYEELISINKMIRDFDKTHSIEDDDYIKKRKALNTMLTGTTASYLSLSSRFGIGPTERTKLPILEDDENETSDPLEILLEG